MIRGWSNYHIRICPKKVLEKLGNLRII
ncbi:MAG: hypothetical protein ACOC90_02660 [Bacteroidota bacterium]